MTTTNKSEVHQLIEKHVQPLIDEGKLPDFGGGINALEFEIKNNACRGFELLVCAVTRNDKIRGVAHYRTEGGLTSNVHATGTTDEEFHFVVKLGREIFLTDEYGVPRYPIEAEKFTIPLIHSKHSAYETLQRWIARKLECPNIHVELKNIGGDDWFIVQNLNPGHPSFIISVVHSECGEHLQVMVQCSDSNLTRKLMAATTRYEYTNVCDVALLYSRLHYGKLTDYDHETIRTLASIMNDLLAC
jgi:hypothetical protein